MAVISTFSLTDLSVCSCSILFCCFSHCLDKLRLIDWLINLVVCVLDRSICSWNRLIDWSINLVVCVLDRSICSWNRLIDWLINLVVCVLDRSIRSWNRLIDWLINFVICVLDRSIRSWNRLIDWLISLVVCVLDRFIRSWNDTYKPSSTCSAISRVSSSRCRKRWWWKRATRSTCLLLARSLSAARGLPSLLRSFTASAPARWFRSRSLVLPFFSRMIHEKSPTDWTGNCDNDVCVEVGAELPVRGAVYFMSNVIVNGVRWSACG